MTVPDPRAQAARRQGRRTDSLFWGLAILIVVGLAGFASLGVWTIVHWPWATWAHEAEARKTATQAARRRAQEPVEVVTRSLPLPPRREVGPHGEVITNPYWVVRPGGDYPQRAQDLGVESGVVQLECEGLASGEVGACEILSEEPAGAGFGEAALAGTRQARLQPASIDGYQTDFTVRFAVRFRLQ